jgi:hypothetical protein
LTARERIRRESGEADTDWRPRSRLGNLLARGGRAERGLDVAHLFVEDVEEALGLSGRERLECWEGFGKGSDDLFERAAIQLSDQKGFISNELIVSEPKKDG